jgi:flagellar hook-associated protein 1 FlgK
MRSTFGGINTVTLGLMAQQASLDTTGQNISNANTPGYSRQTANLGTTDPQRISVAGGPAMIGTGVKVESITRARDSLIDSEYWKQNSTKGFWQAQTDVYGKVEDIFHDTQDAGINSELNKFWTALQTLGADAGDSGARTNVREAANSLVETLRLDNQNLRDLANDLTTQIKTDVDNINDIISQIAVLNGQIVDQEVTSEKANDLRDRRDYLVDKLSAITPVQVVEDQSGAYTVSTNDVTLVRGKTSYQLSITSTHNDLYNFDTNVIKQNGVDVTAKFNGGKLASEMNARDNTIVKYLGDIDNIAKFLLKDFNAQHKAGYDNNGNLGGNFFGNSATNYSTYDPTGLVPPHSWLSELNVNSAFYSTTGLNLIAARGANSSGTGPAGSSDGSNATQLSNLLTDPPNPLPSPANALGNLSVMDYYGTVISTLGVKSEQAKNTNDNQAVLLNSTSNWRESTSGVNIDEEMSNMIRFQKAYGAAANVLSTMSEMLDTLINKTGI